MPDVTRILNAIKDGNPSAADELLPLIYDELRKLAAARMAQESPDHTLQATALVHEAYLRLVGSGDSGKGQQWDGRGHFFAAAAEAMRRILVNRAREKATAKRGGNWERVTLDSIAHAGGIEPPDLIALDDALDQLFENDSRTAEIAKLRIFAGLTIPEVAAMLEIPRRSVDRHWAFARAWLRSRLTDDNTISDK